MATGLIMLLEDTLTIPQSLSLSYLALSSSPTSKLGDHSRLLVSKIILEVIREVRELTVRLDLTRLFASIIA